MSDTPRSIGFSCEIEHKREIDKKILDTMADIFLGIVSGDIARKDISYLLGRREESHLGVVCYNKDVVWDLAFVIRHADLSPRAKDALLQALPAFYKQVEHELKDGLYEDFSKREALMKEVALPPPSVEQAKQQTLEVISGGVISEAIHPHISTQEGLEEKDSPIIPEVILKKGPGSLDNEKTYDQLVEEIYNEKDEIY